MITIIFESHATSFDNENGIASGIKDSDLSELGQKQAKELGARYENEIFDIIFCSDLKRSYRTAEIAFATRNFSIIRDLRLRECDYGIYNGAKIDINTIKAEYLDKPYPGGEGYRQTTEKMKSFLTELWKNHKGKKVMIIGSRATQYGLEALINNVPLATTVTAPWEWQPGWVYCLKNI